jgi:diguanylate cyclase (GGDEF)-like protein/PAS domain S-box-containing protein
MTPITQQPFTRGKGVAAPLGWQPTAFFLKLALLVLGLGSFALMPVIWMYAPGQPLRVFGPVIGIAVAAISWVYLVRGNLYAASRVFAIGAWSLVSALTVWHGGMLAPAVMFYPVVIMLVGWQFNERTTVGVAGLSLLIIAVVSFAEHVGYIKQAPPTHPLIHALVIVMAVSFSTAMIVFLVRSFKLRLQKLVAMRDAHAQKTRELEASRIRLELAIRATNMVFWQYDIVLDRLDYDDDALWRLGDGINVGQKTIQEWVQQIHSDDREAFQARFELAKNTPGLALEMEYRLATANQGWVWVFTSGIVVSRDAAGKPLTAAGGSVNITERKRAELALEMRERYQRALLDNFPFNVWLKDKDSRFLAVNARFADSFGWPDAASLVGKTDFDIAPPVDAQGYRADDHAVLSSGKSKSTEEEVVVNGVRQWHETYKSPVSLGGKVIGTVGFSRDITERRRLQTQIVEREAFLRTIIQAIPDLFWLKNPDGKYLACNSRFEQFMGAKESELLGKTDYDLVSKELADLFLENDKRAMEKLTPSVNEEWVPFASDGHKELLETTKTAVFNHQGALLGVLGIGHDITERKKAEDHLRLAASVFTQAREAIMITASDGDIVDVNEAFTRITGYARNEVLGKNPRIMSSGRQQQDFYATLWTALATHGHWVGEVWNRRKSGEVFAVMQTISAVRDAQGTLQHYVSLFSDITALKEHQHQLEHIANFDSLTNLPNRSLLADRLQQGLAQSQRRGKLLAVAFLDLDGFKSINDTYGHDAGDQLLIALAGRMKLALREGDTLARLGGDEFVAVLVDLPLVTAAEPLLTRLLAAAAHPVQVSANILQVSASLGVTFFPQTEEVDAELMLRQADQAMYQAKLAGKNRYHIFDADHDRSVRGHHESLESIRQGLANREFVLHFQPKVNMRSGKVIGAEALIRWQHPSRGLLAPAVFLPVIEEHPLAVEVGEWVIDAALTQVAQWHAQGLDIPVSVNVGAEQLQQSNFVSRLQELLSAHPQVSPTHLELELLETSALQDIENVSSIIERCRQLGVHFALDDFGTGYSSLTYLKRLPARLLKIDQSFVRDMLDDPEDLAILEGVIGLARAFSRDVIAEGVETLAHGDLLLQLGCEQAQGYGIARPMPGTDFPFWALHWIAPPQWSNQPLIDRDELRQLFATVEHRAWLKQMKDFCDGTSTSPPELDHRECRFGRWLHSADRGRFGATATFKQMDSLHRSVHKLGTELLQHKSAGQHAQAQEKYRQLSAKGQALLVQLKAWSDAVRA